MSEAAIIGYEAAHRAADTRQKREWVRAEALRRDEGAAELCGLLRSTYVEGYPEPAPEPLAAVAAETGPGPTLSETGDFG